MSYLFSRGEVFVTTGPDKSEILDNLYDGVYFVDRQRRITYWNRGAERITGFEADEVIGRRCLDNVLNHVDEHGRLLCLSGCPLLATMNDGEPREADVFLHHSDGHRVPVLVRCAPIHDDDGAVVGAVESFTEGIGTQTTRAELRELRHQTRTDELTGIGNRPFIEGRLRGLIAEYAQQQSDAAVAIVDIDHFKNVNDAHGHHAGDQVLRMVAKTLHGNVRATDSVGRWGGEEFVVIVHDVPSLDELNSVANKLRVLVGRSHFDVGDARVSVTISMGATLLQEEDTPASVLERADRLLYASKASGRNRVSVG